MSGIHRFSFFTNGFTLDSGNNILVTIPNIYLEDETTASLKSFQTETIYRSLSLKNKYTSVTTSDFLQSQYE